MDAPPAAEPLLPLFVEPPNDDPLAAIDAASLDAMPPFVEPPNDAPLAPGAASKPPPSTLAPPDAAPADEGNESDNNSLSSAERLVFEQLSRKKKQAEEAKRARLQRQLEAENTANHVSNGNKQLPDEEKEQGKNYPKESEEIDKAQAEKIRAQLQRRALLQQRLDAQQASIAAQEAQKQQTSTNANRGEAKGSEQVNGTANSETESPTAPPKAVANKNKKAASKNKSKKPRQEESNKTSANKPSKKRKANKTEPKPTTGAAEPKKPIDKAFYGCSQHQVPIEDFRLCQDKEVTHPGSTWPIARLFLSCTCNGKNCEQEGVSLTQPYYCKKCENDEDRDRFSWYCNDCFLQYKPQKRARKKYSRHASHSK